jgi:hypothetical protein
MPASAVQATDLISGFQRRLFLGHSSLVEPPSDSPGPELSRRQSGRPLPRRQPPREPSLIEGRDESGGSEQSHRSVEAKLKNARVG